MSRLSHATFLLLLMTFSFSFIRFEIFYFLPTLEVSWAAYWVCGLIMYIALLNLREIEGLTKVRDIIPHLIAALVCVATLSLIGNVFSYEHVEGVIPPPEILGASIACAAFIFNLFIIIFIFLILASAALLQKLIRRIF